MRRPFPRLAIRSVGALLPMIMACSTPPTLPSDAAVDAPEVAFDVPDAHTPEVAFDAPDAHASDAPDAPDAPDAAAACAVEAPTACPDPAPRYGDVEPIIEARCIPCHNGTPGGPWSLRGYEHVADWQDTIRDELLRCAMPPADAGVALTADERLTILRWLRCGFPR